MAESRNELQKLTECCICFQPFTDPRTLTCFHTFCLDCLEKTAVADNKIPEDTMPCPLCRKHFVIPAEGMCGLQKNFFMENITNFAIMLQRDDSPVIVCDMCKALHDEHRENIKEATMRCLDCMESFCDMCSKAHKLNKLCKTHNIVKIGNETEQDIRKMQPTRNCSIHNLQPLNFYCAECRIILCISCFVESHKLHDCKDVNTVHEEIRRTIEINTMQISSCVEQILIRGKIMETRKTKFLVNLAETEDQILKRSFKLKEMIDSQTKSLLNELSLIKRNQLKDFVNDKEENDRSYVILNSFETYCTELSSKGSAADVCSSVHEITSRANQLKEDHKAFMCYPFHTTEVTFQSTELKEPPNQSSINFVGRIQRTSSSMVRHQETFSETAVTDNLLEKSKERKIVPRGFENYGNACYFNSVLQCLIQTALLTFELPLNLHNLENVHNKREEFFRLSTAFLELFSKYSESEERTGALRTLYDTFRKATQRFHDQRQHDIIDLLNQFLDMLQTEERNVSRMPSAGPDTKLRLTTVDRVLGGQLITAYKCYYCGETHAAREPFLAVSIPLAETNVSLLSSSGDSRDASTTWEVLRNMLEPLTQDKSAESDTSFPILTFTNLSVGQCLKYFTRAEEIYRDQYLCRNCQSPDSGLLRMTSATQRTLISSPPAVLVLHLKRFEERTTGRVKYHHMISYDELLDLGPFCSSSALRIDPEEENVWYSLYGVVVHHGFFLDSQGYNVAYVKQRDSSAQLDDQLIEKFLQKNLVVGHDGFPNDDDLATLMKRNAIKNREKAQPPNPIPGQWFHIRDDTVRPCDKMEALSQMALLLFYERIPGTDSVESK